MWLPLKLLGIAPFRAALEEKLLLARYFHEQIGKVQGFEVGSYPDLSVVTFRYVPKKGDPNAFNEQLVQEVQRDGRVFLSSTMLDGKFILRVAILCFRTHRATIDLTIKILREKVRQIEESG
jgi:aromatic-L-amino-acid decarboxylase